MTPRIHAHAIASGGMLLAALLLTACATGGVAPGGGETGETTPTIAPDPGTGADTPAGFTDRPMLPSCGSVELHQGETIPQDALECLADGGPGGAELTVTAPTVEGDPIVTYYRALPGGGVEVFTDMTQDAYGGGWGYDFCADAAAVDEHGVCVDVATD
ncbi:DUF4362 domain-containing protein [Microbacterium sulfonylureivorans]|uniref:DUF4362 domain-containing protein n=1 Tax=Microbacterium sulfonylureivorans TaxID=2486854 RepID=UPI000FD9A1B0|nr:DUF4362 domain-containing protein [Microbacterium sulfonylureivorans]